MSAFFLSTESSRSELKQLKAKYDCERTKDKDIFSNSRESEIPLRLKKNIKKEQAVSHGVSEAAEKDQLG